MSEELRRLVATRAEHLCEYCLIHEEDTFLGCEVDHIISDVSTLFRTRHPTGVPSLLIGEWSQVAIG
jgi:hypothetical protein